MQLVGSQPPSVSQAEGRRGDWGGGLLVEEAGVPDQRTRSCGGGIFGEDNEGAKSPGGASGKESACLSRRRRRYGFDPWVRKIPWSRKC